MKILFINQTFYPELLATAQQIADLAKFLREKGHDITVFTGQRGYELRQKLFLKKEDWEGIHIERIQSTGFGKTSVLRRVVDSFSFDLMLLIKLLVTPKFDLVVSFTSPPMVGFLGTIFCLLKGGRAVQWLMDVNPDAAFEVGYIRKESYVGRLLNFVFEWTLKNSHEIVVLDRWMKNRIIEHGVTDGKITVIPPWSVIEKNKEERGSSSSVFRSENKLENKFIILYSGNHSIVHPLETVLEAALRLREHLDIVFMFAGSGLRTQDVRSFKEKYSLQNIKQIPWQKREALSDSFKSVDLHLIVMGEKMSGLVHTSKVYSVLSSGRPYLFIGPEKSHVVDGLKECPGGKHIEHGDVDGVVKEILWFKGLSEVEKSAMGLKNQKYLASSFHREVSKGKFERLVVRRELPSLDNVLQETISVSNHVSKSLP